MKAVAILPIKRFAAAKSRLADALAPEERRCLAEAMFADVLAAISRSARIGETFVVSGEPAIASTSARLGAVAIDDPTDSSHSHAAELGIAAALDRDSDCVALLPGDCPLLDPAELDRAIDGLGAEEVLVAPDRHGTGTNALLMRPPDAIAPAFGPGSHNRHLGRAAEAEIAARTIALASLALDADTGADLERIAAELRGDRSSRAPLTRAALRSIDRLGPDV